MNAARRFSALFLALIILLASRGSAQAQGSDPVQYFPETGHNIEGEFLRFYKTAANPTLVFGYPITEQITSKDGKVVQYFQRARFELRTDLPRDQRIQLTALGTMNYKAGSPQLDINNSSACKSFPTGFRACFAFLEFFEANGGAAQFGNPISLFEYHENLIVQYFEKARFEWRADRPEGQRVVISDLGRIYFDLLAEDQAHLKPIRPLDATISSVLSISARAFVAKAITLSSGQQTVHVIVQSQTHQAISNATGRATVRFPDGQSEDYYFSTNPSGLGGVTFQFADQKQGELVRVDVVVTYQGYLATTTTSFRIWY